MKEEEDYRSRKSNPASDRLLTARYSSQFSSYEEIFMVKAIKRQSESDQAIWKQVVVNCLGDLFGTCNRLVSKDSQQGSLWRQKPRS